jgi:hypothetical protein
MYGSVRFAAVYVVAAVGGSLASLWFGAPGMSAGASGAVFGVLGAAIADVAVRARGERRQSWHRAFLGNLVFIALVNLAIGATVPLIDQAAHVGGLLTGGLAGLALTPRTRAGRALGPLAMVLCAGGVALTALAAWGVAVTPYGRTVARQGVQTVRAGHVSADVPRAWTYVDESTEAPPPWPPSVSLDVTARRDMAAVVQTVRNTFASDKRATALTDVDPPAPPPGWSGHGLRFVYQFEDGELRFRKDIYMLPLADEAAVVTVLAPDETSAEIAPVVQRILASVHRP